MRHVFADSAGSKIGRPAGSKRNYHGDRARRIGLRPRDPRDGREGGSTRSQLQKISAGKFHFEPPSPAFSLNHLVGAAGYGLYVFAPAGRRTVKTEPLPGSLATV